MTLIFVPALAFLSGLALGRRWPVFALPVTAWYVALTSQTQYLAHPGVISFDGGPGLTTIQGNLYWLVQPLILALGVGLLFLAAWIRRITLDRVQRVRSLAARVSNGSR